MLRRTVFLLGVSVFALGCGREDSPPAAGPQGKPKEEATRILETSSQTLQSFEPVRAIDTYLDGFNRLKDDAEHVMESHAFCRARNEEFTQCVLFDANTADANMVGIKYIVSERLYQSMPDEEKALWHPLNYEILSGQLVAAGLPDVAEHAFMEKKLNAYAKTWRTWDTSAANSKTLPLGQAALGWSFNADGELPEPLRQERDKRMNIDSAAKRVARTDLAAKAHPVSRPQ
ncbi:MAG: hypothetical protein JWN48_416 [Myxococcaceae bacterium]|nr:hypothetical protein [Myxococcaceae bacterium]